MKKKRYKKLKKLLACHKKELKKFLKDIPPQYWFKYR